MIASVITQVRQLCAGLDTFGENLEAQVVGQGDDCAHDGPGVRVTRQVGDERLIYLHGVDRQALQITQARIASAEVVDRETETVQGTVVFTAKK